MQFAHGTNRLLLLRSPNDLKTKVKDLPTALCNCKPFEPIFKVDFIFSIRFWNKKCRAVGGWVVTKDFVPFFTRHRLFLFWWIDFFRTNVVGVYLGKNTVQLSIINNNKMLRCEENNSSYSSKNSCDQVSNASVCYQYLIYDLCTPL